MRRNLILVEDGATVVVIAKTAGPTVNDPADEFPYVSEAYRVVADRLSPMLKLVPLSDTPTKLRKFEIPLDLLEEQTFVVDRGLPALPPCGGRAHGNTTSGS